MVQAIVEAAQPVSGVLEIGPGLGVLTRPLAQHAQVLAVEVDRGLAERLAGELPEVRVHTGDALQFDWDEALAGLPEPRALVSNMPYNITGPLLGKALEVRQSIGHAVLMMQREVAERILAPAGDSARGALSVSVQSAFEVRRVVDAPPGAFEPPPKVASVVLRLVPRARTEPPGFRDVVRRGFSQPRKTLANNLGSARAVVEAGLPANVRAHQLTEEDWDRLTRLLRL